MPTYSYRCASCGHEFERVQRIIEDPIKTCPECGQDTAHRLINSVNFILKGGGWYSDLYASGSNKKPPATATESAPAPPAVTDGGTQTTVPSPPAATSSTAAPSTSSGASTSPAPSTSSSSNGSST